MKKVLKVCRGSGGGRKKKGDHSISQKCVDFTDDTTALYHFTLIVAGLWEHRDHVALISEL